MLSLVICIILLKRTLVKRAGPDVSAAIAFYPLPSLICLAYFLFEHAVTIPSVLPSHGLVDPGWRDYRNAQSALVAFLGVLASIVLYLVLLGKILLPHRENP